MSQNLKAAILNPRKLSVLSALGSRMGFPLLKEFRRVEYDSPPARTILELRWLRWAGKESSKMLKKITIESTSLQSADVIEPVVLRRTKHTRLVFQPTLVDNPTAPEASVRGSLVFQRKGQNDEWEDWKDFPLSTLKKAEGVKLELRSAALLRLFQSLSDLYELYRKQGIATGSHTYIRASQQLVQIAKLSDESLAEIAEADQSIGIEALCRLLRWATELPNVEDVIEQLEQTDTTQLANISALAGIAAVQRELTVWRQNKKNGDEEFWQKELVKHPFLLEHLFSFPVVVVKDNAYVGGKNIFNVGGNLVDFLLKNEFTDNVVLVEIKTPITPLLGREYRRGIFNVSKDLSGAVMQVLNYRVSFTRELHNFARGIGMAVDSSEPPCQVIIGNTNELDSDDKRKSFELFRRQFPGVGICTYDEVFRRSEKLVNLLVSRRSVGKAQKGRT